MRSAAVNPAEWPAAPEPDGTGLDVMVPGEPSGTARGAGGITLGVEEEFVLLDPADGTAVLAGPELARMLGGEPGVQQELMRFQVETATRVCTSLEGLGRELARLRRLTADAAASAGCRLVASGIAPYRAPGLAAMTDHPRYRKLARSYGQLVTEAGGACGCHVHVGVPSRDLGVQVLARLRPWLASAARHHRQLTDRRRPRHGLGELAVPGLVTLADGGAARGVAGRRRLRYGGPPPHRAGRGGR